jgi:hypothetical protein
VIHESNTFISRAITMSTPSATLSAVSGGGTTSSTCQHHKKASVLNYIVVENKFEVLANTS